ncbi:MAG TPA: membrane protein insertase YidC [Actinocrinis sp.]|jgi:YidC/Oxa1 family membrane protein insertase
MSVLAPVLLAVYHVVSGLAVVLVPVLGGAGPAAAIIVFTVAVRSCLYPLNRAQMRAQNASQQARAALAPAVQKLKRKYRNDPARLQIEMLGLYRANGISLTAGIKHSLVQVPVFFVVYRMFELPVIAGHHNALMSDRLVGVGLGSHLADVLRGPVLMPGHIAVFAVLLAVIAAVAAWSSARARKSMAVAVADDPSAGASAAGITRMMGWLPFGTIVTAAIVPLAAGLYLATTTLWSVLERRHLQKTV